MGDTISAVLVDVGGTLWPDKWPSLKADDEIRIRIRRLRDAVPGLTHALGADIVRRLHARTVELESSLAQDADGLIRETVHRLGLRVDEQGIVAIRRAMSIPASGRIEPFGGAQELLESVKELNLRCILVSNATWRDGQNYRRDFEDMGISANVDAIVSSVDVGFRKPHPAIFEAAIAAAGCAARYCIFVGNSERNDVQPALSLGMRAIRVCIEEPKPLASGAHAVTGSLHEAAGVLRAWASTGTMGE